MSPTILLFGKNGQIGWELQRALQPIAQVISFDRQTCNIVDYGKVEKIIDDIQPDVIVNAAAYTNVDRAENENELCLEVNCKAAGMLAACARSIDALLVHFSTDYVFNGEKTGPYTEEDCIAPLSTYGQSKALGEQAIEKSGCRFLIFRTSWIYGAHGENFAKKIFKLAAEKDRIHVVADQVGAPTSAELVADIVAHALPYVLSANAPLGLYHIAAAGTTSWHGYACHLLSRAKHYGIPLRTYSAEEIPSNAYRGLAVRPKNSLLDTTKLQASFNVSLPDWRYHVERFVQNLSDNQ